MKISKGKYAAVSLFRATLCSLEKASNPGKNDSWEISF